ncbi:MAG: hypothetical protein IT319_09425 [Anaerolineae bacterium]|nr:hypothetical protein [Anaerolineae bacterium]
MSQHTRYSSRDERNGFLWAWLALVILNNLFTLVSFLTGGNNPLAYITPADNTLYSSSAVVVVNIAAAAAIVFCILTGLGYRIGYWGLVVAHVIMTIASLMIGFNIGIVLVSGLVVLITWVLLRPSWNRLK